MNNEKELEDKNIVDETNASNNNEEYKNEEEYEFVKKEILKGTHTSGIDTPERLMMEKFGINIKDNPKYVVEFLNGGAHGDFDDYVASDYVVFELEKRKKNKGYIDDDDDDKDDDKGKDDDDEKNNEPEERIKVTRVVEKYKDRLAAWLLATALAATLLTGFDIVDIINRYDVKDTIPGITYNVDEQVREKNVIDQQIKQIIYSFVTDRDFKIGDEIRLNPGLDLFVDGSYRSNGSKTVGTEPYKITGFCISSGSGKSLKYHSYTDNNNTLDDNPIAFQNGLALSIKEFLKEVNATGEVPLYDLSNIRFAMHVNGKGSGWIECNDFVKPKEDVFTITTKSFIDVIKKGASFSGFCDDVNAQSINIAADGATPILINIRDQNNNLLAPGTVVIGTDGKEYIISSLEEDALETTIEKESVTHKISYNIIDCELAAGLVPALLSGARAIAAAVGNEKRKNNPKIFKFDKEEAREGFKDDFKNAVAEEKRKEDDRYKESKDRYVDSKAELRDAKEAYKAEPNEETERRYQEARERYDQARDEHRKNSKFGKIMSEIFIGKKVDYASDLKDKQIDKMFDKIISAKEEKNGFYTFNERDKLSIHDGQFFAIREEIIDGEKVTRKINITEIVSGVGKNNKGIEGKLTPEIVEKYGGKK